MATSYFAAYTKSQVNKHKLILKNKNYGVDITTLFGKENRAFLSAT